jgi:hypothetical protein
MATVPQLTMSRSHSLLRGSMVFLALLVTTRFVLELAGVSQTGARYLSGSAGLFLAAIFIGAVAPLRGVHKLVKLALPAVILSAWTVGWIVLYTVISAVFRLQRSHYAEPEDYGNWTHLGHHLLEHVLEIGIFAMVAFILMTVPFLLRRWPITVAPAAVLGGLVVMRYTTEALGADPSRAAAWSSTVGILLCGFYLGGSARWFGISSGGQLLVPAVVLGWTWRFWAFFAALLSAAFYKTHFFDPSQGQVVARLLRLLGFSVVEGFLAGLLVVWIIALWIFGATSETAMVVGSQKATPGTQEPGRLHEEGTGGNVMRKGIA